MIVRARGLDHEATECAWCGGGPLLLVECNAAGKGSKCAECWTCGAHLAVKPGRAIAYTATAPPNLNPHPNNPPKAGAPKPLLERAKRTLDRIFASGQRREAT